ncbi:FecCD family ABC transporter permease [Gracilinema caldarium]|uniref:ABC-type transporter, integral membrane subunit n=1 Tax=Gracilinema caldarium (strain ATCC 51460 / DSM 7334 / H1) TaxID=744872 RepID=F8F1A4_GRAC1|nr:iron ABC transporter permease [Gracilinema caldarium]AEJ18748.1 ABC-type transporter, integral membrane subunit [Gracilinema caldarium DSM 7334]
MSEYKPKKLTTIYWPSGNFPDPDFFVSTGLGHFPLSPLSVLCLFWIPLSASDVPPDLQQASLILFKIRLPRLLGAALVGAALAASGAAYQGLFQNPLVSPDVLGVSAGDAFGAVLSLLLGLDTAALVIIAFLCGLGTALLVSFFARTVRAQVNLSLVLSGIMLGSLLSSATSLVKLVADPVIILSLGRLLAFRWRINILIMGEEEARTLGTCVPQSRALLILAATLATASSVAICGPVGWVGLVIPHFARMVAGSDFRILMPVSLLMGASFLMLVDDFSRLLTTSEIPIGILTSFVGVLVFLLLIYRGAVR